MAVDFYLKLDGIDGEAVRTGHDKWIALHSWSWGGSQTTTVHGTGGSGAGKVSLADFNVTKHYDKSSPALFKSMCGGTHIKTGTFEALKAGGNDKPFLKLSFEELFVTSQQCSAADEVPIESVSFSYNKIKIEYSMQNEQGVLAAAGQATYDVKIGKLS